MVEFGYRVRVRFMWFHVAIFDLQLVNFYNIFVVFDLVKQFL